MEKIIFVKKERFGCVSVQQNRKEIAIVELSELKEFLNNKHRDIAYIENLKM